MKKILLSVHPKYCERIFNGKKTIEVRKNYPLQVKPPFEVLVYCTMPKERWSVGHQIFHNDTLYTLPTGELKTGDALELRADWLGKYNEDNFLNGKVIGSFVCDDVITDFRGEHSDDFAKYALLSLDEQKKYSGNKLLYGWHIIDPKLFDKPRELGEFYTICNKYGDDSCGDCPYLAVEQCSFPCDDCVDTWCSVDNIKPITRPPQSWCYVEER